MNDAALEKRPGLSPVKLMAGRVLAFQSALGLVCSLLFLVFGSGEAGLSVLLGVLCAVLPNLAFFLLLRRNGGASPESFFRLFRRGEALKILLTIGLFVIILFLKIPGLQALSLFAGYALVLLGHWISLVFSLKSEPAHGS